MGLEQSASESEIKANSAEEIMTSVILELETKEK